ncbi:MAG: UDP-N-acetylglucosamine 1-carboxyvinyltransferase [Clostridia bacterium]|nr:UDP-N-acetylglucosamine 1-carboxyvinyltransferase [Clostridia bacterium]
MDELYVEGGHRLVGELPIHGAKNSVLPLLAATVLVPQAVTFTNCPSLSDVDVALAILGNLGCKTRQNGTCITVDGATLSAVGIPDGLMRQMRSSIVFLGPLLARCGEATVSLPGGCELGPRPIDWHLSALEKLGAQVTESAGRLCVCAPRGLRGCELSLAFPSVGTTENVLMAASLAKGVTVLHNAAQEPEVADLCRFLNCCGARITGVGGSRLVVEGVARLHGCTYRVMPDRMETITYALAAAVTGGELSLVGVDKASLCPTLSVLEEMGCTLHCEKRRLSVKAPTRLACARGVRSMPYPGFPTDAMAPFMTAACVANGTSVFTETVFENRYRHVDELRRMGARIRVNGRVAVVDGDSLHGATVQCTDLRGGAALLLAALAADGESRLGALQHLERGYPAWEDKLRRVGAQLYRIK